MTKHEIDIPGHPDYGKYEYIFDQEEFNKLKVILSDLITTTEYNCDQINNCNVVDYGLEDAKDLIKTFDI